MDRFQKSGVGEIGIQNGADPGGGDVPLAVLFDSRHVNNSDRISVNIKKREGTI
jgi:hypothetical protein